VWQTPPVSYVPMFLNRRSSGCWRPTT
jgi:hypothetical protein